MAEPLFISQAKLEGLIDRGEVAFDNNILTIFAQRRSYRMAPAVRVTSLIDGKDNHRLVGRVLPLAELGSLGGEHCAGTIILGDTGYECEDGYVGTEQIGAQGAPAGIPAPTAATAAVASSGASARVGGTTAPAATGSRFRDGAPPPAVRAATPPSTTPARAAAAPATAAVESGDGEPTKSDTDLLADFLLKHL